MRRAGPLVAGVLVAALVAGCSDGGEGPASFTQPSPTETTTTPSATPDASESTRDSPASGPPRVLGTVAEGLEVPWGLDFLPDGTALLTERDTRRVLSVNQSGAVTEIGVVEAAVPEGEAGLLGLAVSPDFARDRAVYLYVTTDSDNRVVRTELTGDGPGSFGLGPLEVVLDGIPKGFIHDGGRLRFGPEGHLFVSTGETGEPSLAQDPSSLAGKILRITTDGQPAPGNPDPGSPVWSLGHRNVQGLAFDGSGRLWASEFGDSTFDELNLIEAGANYGWPEVEGKGGEPEFVDPHVTWNPADASPSGLAFADGHLWMAALRGGRLWRIDVEDGRATDPQAFFTGEHGRLRSVAVAPDGTLWVATSNRDGRGDPRPGDDRILRIRP